MREAIFHTFTSMALMAEPTQSPAPGLFPATAWTLVQRAVDGVEAEQRAALNDLFGQYWQPIYVYLRRSGRASADAEDLTQGYFTHLLEKKLLDRVRQREVKFRAFLRGTLEHYLANEARTANAGKRFGGRHLDVAAIEEWLLVSPAEPAGAAFDAAWAVGRLEAAVTRLRMELRANGREWVADALVRRAGAGVPAVSELSRKFGVTENQLTVALHRARGRLRELILEDIRESVSTAAEAEDELNHLFAALRGSGRT
jgi:DNA-directed RNA polymerase specialized sigma24 family protein